ncbi:MAG: MFS transporter, partial [Actinobacteria bacterium]|nr:MFS transporter [Actinomycetota bacterium]
MSATSGPVGTERYRALLRTPHARRLIACALVARLPLGMVPLALLLTVREAGGSYAAAGAVSGAYLVAAGIGAPVAGRLVDRQGQTRVLVPRAALFSGLLLGVCALALVEAPLLALGGCAAAAGAFVPPVAASLRSLWPRLLEGPELRASAYALEASLQEIFFLVGPLIVALVSATVSPTAALVVAAAAGGAGTLAFAASAPVRAWRPETDRHVSGLLGALESPGVRTIVLFAACCGVAFGGTEVAMPAFAEDHGGAELGGVPLALFAGGSLVGGLVAGARTRAPPPPDAAAVRAAARRRSCAAGVRGVAPRALCARVRGGPADRAGLHGRVRAGGCGGSARLGGRGVRLDRHRHLERARRGHRGGRSPDRVGRRPRLLRPRLRRRRAGRAAGHDGYGAGGVTDPAS